MNKKEFDARQSLINNMRDQAIRYKEILDNEICTTSKELGDVARLLKIREESLRKYINFLKDFSYDDSLTVPSDLFPGIRTASQSADPEDLRLKSEEMKQLAFEVNSSADLFEGESKSTLKRLRNLLDSYVECIKKYNQLYELEIELIKDMDSVYDVGLIARNS